MASFILNILSPTNVLLGLGTIILAYLIKQLIDALRPRLPPGPWGLPFVGYLLKLKPDRIHRQYHELAEKYGDIVSVRLGQRMTILLNTRQTMKDVFKLQEATDRPYSPLFQVMIDSGESSLVFSNGPGWKFARKIGSRAVGIFGSSKNSKLESLVHTKVNEMKDAFKESLGEPITTKDIMIPYVTELVSHLSYGGEMKRGSHVSDEMHHYLTSIGEIMEKIWLPEFFPLVRHLLSGEFKKLRNIMDSFAEIRCKLLSHDRKPNVETLADAVLKAADEATDEEKREVNMTTDDIRRIGIDLFDASIFTTSENLEWILLLLASFPEKQRKLQEELKAVLGTRDVSINDEANLPFAKAFIIEALRYVSNTALGVPHMAGSDIEINGYVIPAGATIVGNVWTINHDPKTFEEPMEFIPERFISNGVFDQKLAENMMVFSTGKRRCIGENMAKQELFLITAMLMQTFKLEVDPNTQKPSLLDGVMTVTIAAKPHKLIFSLLEM